MIADNKITEIFYLVDDFSKIFNSTLKANSISDGKKHRNKPSKLTDSEVIMILLLFHFGGFRCFKHFYINYIQKYRPDLFPRTVSYNRFVELESNVAIMMGIFIKECLLAECTGISFIDSTAIAVCKHQRIHCHKTFAGLASRGKCSMGWFFGFKLHLIINDKGEIINFMITPGNVDDREPLYSPEFVEKIYGKLVGDRGYISKTLFENLFIDGIQLVTKIRSNMKNVLTSVIDKILIRNRAIIESVNDELKNITQIEHSRHRSVTNFLSNTFAAIVAYCFFDKKTSLNIEFENDNQLSLF